MTTLSTERVSFPLGRVLITTGAEEKLHPAEVIAALRRHARGDWGELDPDDHAENQLALREGLRLFSVYRDRYETRFYIITEADRSVTTILLPDEY